MRPLFLAVALIGLGTLTVLFLRSRPDVTAPPPTPASAPASSPEPTLPLEQPHDSPSESRAVSAAPQPAPTTPSSPRSHVFGRIVDSNATPQPSVTVYLTSGDRWSTLEDAPKLTIRGYPIEGFQTQSDAAGRFSFTAPVPTSDWVSLWFDPPPYLGIGGREFGPAGGRNQPRLLEGENDLGDLPLAITGAVEGDVHGADGTRISNAKLSLHGAFPGGRGVSADADERGHFLLGHIPAGRWTLQAEAEGWQLVHTEGVEVRERSTTPGLVFTLERAPTLRGVVVDEHGTALENIRVWGWPNRSGKGAGARSQKDGSFTINLPQPDPYILEVKQRGFSEWGGHGSDKLYTPGTNDIRIVLHRLASTSFLVVDATSGAPIERYAIAVAEVGPADPRGNDANVRLETQEHPGGRVELAAEPQKHAVFVDAQGYVRLHAPVQPDATGTQTLQLVHGTRIRGRVSFAGQPVARPDVRLQRAFIKTDPSQPDVAEDEQWFADGYGYDLTPFVGAERQLTGEPDGSFEIDALASGTWRLEISAAGAAPRIFRELKPDAAHALDLGEIALVAGATVQGRLILPAGQSPIGRELYVDDFKHKLSIQGADGAFRFEGLGAGKHTLTLQRGQDLQRDEQREFELAAGETRDILLDLTARAPCAVRLHLVWLPLQQQQGLRVLAQRIEDGQRTQVIPLGTSDTLGVVAGSVEGGSVYEFAVLSPTGVLLARTPSVSLASGGTHEGAIEISAGTLAIVLPDSLAIPEAGQLTVFLRDAQDEGAPPIRLHLSTEKSPFPGGQQVWNSRRVELGAIRAGRYTLRVNAQRWTRRDGTNWVGENLLGDAPESEIVITPGEPTVHAVATSK